MEILACISVVAEMGLILAIYLRKVVFARDLACITVRSCIIKGPYLVHNYNEELLVAYQDADGSARGVGSEPSPYRPSIPTLSNAFRDCWGIRKTLIACVNPR